MWTLLAPILAQWGSLGLIVGLLGWLLWREKSDHQKTRDGLVACQENRIAEARAVIPVLEASTAAREHRIELDQQAIAAQTTVLDELVQQVAVLSRLLRPKSATKTRRKP